MIRDSGSEIIEHGTFNTIDGDTELGLLVKNALDAIDWSRLTGRLEPVIARLRRLAEGRGGRR